VIEDTNHILKCQGNDTCKQIRRDFLKNLSYQMRQMHTNEVVIRVFMAYLTAWLSDAPTPDINQLVDEPSTTLIEAVYSQTLLGWGDIFRGRLVPLWATLYNHDIFNNPLIPNHQDNEVWGKRIVTLAWDYVFKMWEARNDVEHDNGGDPALEVKRKIVLKILWSVNQFSPEVDHPYKNFTELELLDLPLVNLQMIDAQAVQFNKWNKNKKIVSDQEGAVQGTG
jgi:hypothetical protein